MSLLRTFKDYLRFCKDKNLLIQPALKQQNKLLPTFLINEITHPSSISNEKEKLNDAQLVKENYEKIGKGSMFERKNVEEYLKSLGPTSLKRSELEANEFFDEEKAQRRHNLGKSLQSLENSSPLQFNMEQEDIRLIFEKLIAITPRPNGSADSPRIMINDSSRQKRKLPRHIYTEIPPVPEFGESASAFEEYVHLLTNATFHYKQSSKTNGIIPKILKNFFHPLNSNTIPLRTVNSYNDVILYFSRKWNIATCREFLVQMKLENVKPNTTTFNIMLRSLLTQQNIRHTADPYKIIISYLNSMKQYEIDADLVTWNVIFNLLKDEISKKLLLENRMFLGIPVDEKFIQSVVKDLSLRGAITSRDILKTFQEFNISLDSKLITIVMKQLIREENILAAWKVAEYSKKEKIRSSVDQMNLLLAHFSSLGRVDLVVATMNTFRRRYKVSPDIESYKLVMKSISRSKYWSLQLPALRVLYHQMMKDTKNCVAGEYWIRRIRSRLKFIFEKDVELKPELTPEELQLKEDIKNIKWNLGSEIIDLTEKIPSEYLDTATKLGFNASTEKIDFDNLDVKKKKAKDYKDRIALLSVQKGLVKRVPYAEDSYGALKKEMKERNIIVS